MVRVHLKATDGETDAEKAESASRSTRARADGISESEDTSWRTSRVLASIGQPLIYLSALLAGDFEWLRDAFLGLGEPT